MFLAFGCAVALAALALGLVHWRPADDREAAPLARIVLERAPTPRPTPAPTPPPTPRPTPVARVTPARVPQRAAPRRAAPNGGARPAPSAVPSVVVPQLAVAVPSAAPADAGPVEPGTGTGVGAGAGAGSGAGAGTGSGNGTSGSGTGQVNADVPCGFVEFRRTQAPRYERGTAYERIQAWVHFRDGHVESAIFPYEWAYPNPEQTDPWSSTQVRLHPDAPVYAQLPRAGTDPRGIPLLIRYILDHTRANGGTVLEDCPASRP